MSLIKVRAAIDRLDRELVRLLKKRMDLALKTKQFKTQVEDLSREEEVENNLKSLAKEFGLDFDYLKKLYEIIINEGKKRQIQGKS